RAAEKLVPPPSSETPPPGALARVLLEFGQGAADGWGPEPLGLTPSDAEGLRQIGIFADPTTGRGGPGRVLHEGLIRPAATLVDSVGRGSRALVFGGARALGRAYVEAGGSEAGGGALMRDLIALATVASIALGSKPVVRPGLIREASVPTRNVGR